MDDRGMGTGLSQFLDSTTQKKERNMSKSMVLFIAIGLLFLSTILVATAVQMPEFRSGASVEIGVPVDFNVLSQRVGVIYDVIESNDSHIIWKFTGTTGDWAFVFADGRLVVASMADLDLSAKDTLEKELNDEMDMLNVVGGGVSDVDREHAIDNACYYAKEAGVYHRIKYSFNKDFGLHLTVPNCTMKKARLMVSGAEFEYEWCTEGGQYYYIDDNYILGCKIRCDQAEQGCEVKDIEIADKIPYGVHSITASGSIRDPHTMFIEAITAPTTKGMALYSDDYKIWVEETTKSLTLSDLYALISPKTTTEQIPVAVPLNVTQQGPLEENLTGISSTPEKIDPSPLLNGVTAICAGEGNPGPLVALNETPVPVVGGDNDTTPANSVVVMASGLGGGRVVALGHEGFFTNESLGLFDNKRFGDNIVDWLDAGLGKHKMLVTTGHEEWLGGDNSDSFKAGLERRGFTVARFSGTITPTVLSDVSIVFIGIAWGNISRSEIDAIRDFVSKGGGLFLMGLGWSWKSYKGPLDEYSMNKIAEPYGIQWIDGYVQDPTDNYNGEGHPVFHTFYSNITGYKPPAIEAELIEGAVWEVDASSGWTIQAAVDQAKDGDTIKVAPGTYQENVKVDKLVTIIGAGPGKTIVDGNRGGSVFQIGAGSNVVLSNMTIKNGQSPYSIDGGGIHIDGGTVMVTKCQISGNTGSSAGGIGLAHNANLNVIDSEISNNSASAGGGGGVWTMDSSNTITMINSTIAGNRAYAGGGIENLGIMTVTGSTISGNTAYAENQGGGGILNLGTAMVNNSEISRNSANGPGAGIFNYKGGTLKLSHDVVKKNTASGGSGCGGGIRNEGMMRGQETCTFEENQPEDIVSLDIIEKGHGAWLYGREASYIDVILGYNKISSSKNKIKYIFCRVGGLNLNNQSVANYDNSTTSYYRENLPNCKIYPMLDASDDAGIIKTMNSEQFRALAQNIADRINVDPNADGVHLDIEPYDDRLVDFVEELRTKTNKPVTVAIGIPNPKEKLFNSASIVVLMNYDLNTNIAEFERLSRDRAITFLGLAKKANGYGMIGVPAIATHHEYEYRNNRKSGERQQSNNLMAEYLDLSIKSLQNSNIEGGNFLGLSIWAFINEPIGLYDPKEDWSYYPYILSNKELIQIYNINK